MVFDAVNVREGNGTVSKGLLPLLLLLKLLSLQVLSGLGHEKLLEGRSIDRYRSSVGQNVP